MKISPLNEQLGALVTDIDITKALPIAEKQKLQLALTEHSLLLFRGETLSAQQQINFSRTFGELEVFPWHPSQIKGAPEIFRLANDPNKGYENVGMYWHSDGTFREKSTPISIFHLIEVPEHGGDTWFSHLRKTWLSLPENVKEKIHQLKTVHSNNVIHPLVNKHPVTGHEHIYINVGLTAGILGLSTQDSRDVIGQIDQHLSLPKNSYQHQWKPGDLLVADNFGVAHQAIPVGKTSNRILHRTTIDATSVWWR